ncbi:sensor histidine kinase [Pedobacter cryophilus]|nr:histidine kinase [Pedobacter cryophilus]
MVKKTLKSIHKLALAIILELFFYYLCGYGIYYLLFYLQINPLALSPTNPVFLLASIYRALYILGLSTAYWTALTVIQKNKNISALEKTQLTSELEAIQLKTDLLLTENAFIKAQIHPHALFNQLNFLYNEIRKVDKNIASHLLSFAELMRYNLMGKSSTSTVPLKDELNYISHFIKLQLLRKSFHIVVKNFIEPQDKNPFILPYILITVVENMFQHGELSDAKQPGRIHLSFRKGYFLLKTSNPIRKDQQSGNSLGLLNLTKRLALFYPQQHEMVYYQKNHTFFLRLKINLSKPQAYV